MSRTLSRSRTLSVRTQAVVDLKGPAAASYRPPEPRNPRHFETIEGGREGVSDSFTARKNVY